MDTKMRLSRAPALRSLRAFCVAARHRSFKIAADDLSLTPSAVSHQMRELEDALGVRLFERKTRALELTQAGHVLLEEVEPLLEALDRGLTRIARRNNRRRLRVLAPPFFASELFMPRLASFCAAHPDIDIQIDTPDARLAVHPPTADVSILITDAIPQGLKAAQLFPMTLVAVCAQGPAAVVLRLGPEAFREMTLIVHKARPHAWSSWAEEVGIETPEPKNVVELDTMFMVVRAAEHGLGIALVPEALCQRWFQSGALVRIFSVRLHLKDAYSLVYRPRDASKLEIAAFSAWALEEFGAVIRARPE
jgi:LysR family glycine cleavage system transcriptional activator